MILHLLLILCKLSASQTSHYGYIYPSSKATVTEWMLIQSTSKGYHYAYFQPYNNDCYNPTVSVQYEAIDYPSSNKLQIRDSSATLIEQCQGVNICNSYQSCVTDHELSSTVSRYSWNEVVRIYVPSGTQDRCSASVYINANVSLTCTPQSSSSSNSDSETYDPGAVSGGVIFAVLNLVCCACVLQFYRRCRRRRASPNAAHAPQVHNNNIIMHNNNNNNRDEMENYYYGAVNNNNNNVQLQPVIVDVNNVPAAPPVVAVHEYNALPPAYGNVAVQEPGASGMQYNAFGPSQSNVYSEGHIVADNNDTGVVAQPGAQMNRFVYEKEEAPPAYSDYVPSAPPPPYQENNRWT